MEADGSRDWLNQLEITGIVFYLIPFGIFLVAGSSAFLKLYTVIGSGGIDFMNLSREGFLLYVFLPHHMLLKAFLPISSHFFSHSPFALKPEAWEAGIG